MNVIDNKSTVCMSDRDCIQHQAKCASMGNNVKHCICFDTGLPYPSVSTIRLRNKTSDPVNKEICLNAGQLQWTDYHKSSGKYVKTDKFMKINSTG